MSESADYHADKPTKNAVLPGISRSDYFKIDAVNISLLVEGERSMAHLKWAKDNKRESTDAMDKGTALHLAVLEPNEFEKRVIVFPHPNCEAKVKNGAKWDKFEADNKGKLIINPKAFDDVISMRDALRKHPRVKEILEAKGTGEMGVVWFDEESGLWCKGLVDRFCQLNLSGAFETVVPDLKSCQDARPTEFARTVWNFNYHTKAAFYMDGLNTVQPRQRRFLWIAIESEPPHGIMIYDPSETMLIAGRAKYRRLLKAYAECLKSGEWPGYPLGEETIELPKWSKE